MKTFTPISLVLFVVLPLLALGSAWAEIVVLPRVRGVKLQPACSIPAAGTWTVGVMRQGRFVPLSEVRRLKAAAYAKLQRQEPVCRTLAQGDPPPEDVFQQWEQQMFEEAVALCDRLFHPGLGVEAKLAETYYDAEWIFYQISDYMGDPTWYECAGAAEAIYRDRFVLPSGGRIPGYWVFTHGLAEDYLRTGDPDSRAAVVALAHEAAYASDDTPLNRTIRVKYSREVAYLIMAYLNAELVGEPRRARLAQLVDQALGHMDQWFITRSAPYVRPFMVALTAQALISYHEQARDRDMVPVIRQAMDWLWEHTWLPSSQSFMYTDRQTRSGGQEAAPDLNLLVAPAFAWLYYQTGMEVYRDRADQIFAGGVRAAYLGRGKQFNQNYRWSFAYLRWRSGSP